MNVNRDHIIELPENYDLKNAAAIPEAWLTAYQLCLISQIKKNDFILVHAAASGVGTALIQMIKNHFKGESIALASTDDKLKFCKE